jgi:hypothetical protein
MSAQVVEAGRGVPSYRMSSKSRRLAVLLAILVTISIAVNAMIIVAAGSGMPSPAAKGAVEHRTGAAT